MVSARAELRVIFALFVCISVCGCDRGAAPDAADADDPLRADTSSRALQLADPQLFAACDSLQVSVDSVTTGAVERINGGFTGSAAGEPRYGCRIATTDTLQPDSPQRPLEIVWQALVARGWTLDQAYVADGPDGSMLGLRVGSMLCVLQHYWDTGSDDERVTRPDAPFRYDIAVECFREEARDADSVPPPDTLPAS